LFDLHYQPTKSHNIKDDKDISNMMLVLNKLYDDHNLAVNPVHDIENVSNNYVTE